MTVEDDQEVAGEHDLTAAELWGTRRLPGL
jgi:hypothetical protein